jgi:hypothetical protein
MYAYVPNAPERSAQLNANQRDCGNEDVAKYNNMYHFEVPISNLNGVAASAGIAVYFESGFKKFLCERLKLRNDICPRKIAKGTSTLRDPK